MPHVLLIEPEHPDAGAIAAGLTDEGITVTTADDRELALKLVAAGDIDLVLLDIQLPNGPDLKLLRKVHECDARLPVFILSSLDETGPMVVGLDAGADDYITKPMSAARLAARIRSRLRRNGEEATLSTGPLKLDLECNRVFKDGSAIELSPREVGLLAAFMRHEGSVLSRDELLEKVWHVDFDPGSNVVSVYVRSLRKKIGEHFVETVPREGYRFVVPSN
jgi:DNA-binding response OmpR family regulator